eukprot:SAG11_NODE_283_length_11241_cov_8.234428_9_plen_106_part_00
MGLRSTPVTTTKQKLSLSLSLSLSLISRLPQPRTTWLPQPQAAQLASEFGAQTLDDLDDTAVESDGTTHLAFEVIVATIPAAAQFNLPPNLFGGGCGEPDGAASS